MVSGSLQQQWPWCLSAASQQQLVCQQLPNSNCFGSSFPTAIVLTAASQQQLFCQQHPNSKCFQAASQRQLFCQQLANSKLFCQQLPNSNYQPAGKIVSSSLQQQSAGWRQDCQHPPPASNSNQLGGQHQQLETNNRQLEVKHLNAALQLESSAAGSNN